MAKKPLITPSTLQPGDKIAVLSPSWSAPSYFPAVHEQALRRISEELDLIPVEYPTTRKMGASAEERAADINAAFADPEIRGIFATVGGADQITVIPHLNPELPRRDPKPFFGYSDNTNLLNWLWNNGMGAYHGGSTMVHLGSGPKTDPEHMATLRAALFGGGDLALPRPTHSQDYGFDWSEPRAVTDESPTEPAIPLEFLGSDDAVRGHTWGGCMEVLDQLAMADRFPQTADLEGAIIILETSEEIPSPALVGRWIRSMGERGYLEAAAGLVFARPVVDDRDKPASAEVREIRRETYIEYVLTNIARYRNDLLVCLNLPIGHPRPQLVIPYGGDITLDPATHTVIGHYPQV
ncbi:MAG: LD-carboxypeptidase [Actinomycetaceae bacterium]|nr:LD-carboxypeptidase [Actinomycetaceae bacterium]